MAPRGPLPDPNARRRNKRPAPTVVVQDDQLRGPELPDTMQWPPQTVAWWDTWRRSPISQTFNDTSWSFLLDTALLHAALWLGDVRVAPELRQRLAQFGATPADQVRLRLQVEGEIDKAVKRPAGTVNASRKSVLLKVVQSDGASA